MGVKRQNIGAYEMSRSTADRVELLLKNYPETRNSDKELIITFMDKLGANFTPEQIEIIKLVSFESITRCRRKFQEKGMYLATGKIAQERKLKASLMQYQAPKAEPRNIPDILDTTGQVKLI